MLVALLAEGVDRNLLISSERRNTGKVALLAEGVDRNILIVQVFTAAAGRPPRGGRG